MGVELGRQESIGAGGRAARVATAYDPKEQAAMYGGTVGPSGGTVGPSGGTFGPSGIPDRGLASAAPSPVESATLDLIAARETLAVRLGHLENRLAPVLPQDPEETEKATAQPVPDRGSSMVARCINEEARNLLRLADKIGRLTDRLEV